MRHTAVIVSMLLGSVLGVFAQTQANTGQIEGIVTDPVGASVPGAAVTIRNLDTNQVHESKTDTAGFYHAALLQIGPYEITVQAAGFALYKQTGISLSTAQILAVNPKLVLSGTQQQVTVSADAALLETAQVSNSRAVNQTDIATLPNLSRSELNFAFLQPFVNGNRPREYEAPRLDIGGLSQRVNFQVDGFQNSATQQKDYRVIIFSTAALQETQIASFGANAESGRTGGGVVNNIIRSGTNQFHGQATYLTSRESINAHPYGDTDVKPSGNVGVGAVGGPIQHDRLFFFGSYEISHRAFPATLGFTTPAARANAAALGLTDAEIDVLPASFNPQLWLVKFDWRPTEKHVFSLRGNTFREFLKARDPGGTTVVSSSYGAYYNEAAAAFSWTYTISPAMVNEFRTQLSDRFSRRRPDVLPGPNTPPQTTVSGVATFGYPGSLTANREKIAEWSDNLTGQTSHHQVKFGVNVVFSPLDYEAAMNPSFTFGGLAASGSRGAVSALDQYLGAIHGTIDPATGKPFTYTQLSISFGNPLLRYDESYYGAYVQDQWRATRNLTLNFGVRWETVLPPAPNQTAPNPLSRQFNADLNNFAPRFGFAWAPRGSQKTVLRGSYGVFYDAPQGNYYRDALLNNALNSLTYQISGTSAGAPVYPNYPTSPSGLTAVKPSINVLDPDLAWMYVQQTQLGIQRQIAPKLALSVTYSLVLAAKIPVAQNANLAPAVGTLPDGRAKYSSARLDPAFNNITMITGSGNSNYNGLGVNLNKRFARGIQFNLSYTWSHALNNAPEPGIASGTEYPQDGNNRRAEYGNAQTDVRHILNGSAVFRPRFDNRALDNNEFAFFFFARTGTTFNILSGTDLNGDSVNNDRPYFFGRNTGKGPASAQLDVRYGRFLRMPWERVKAEFIAEAANVLNTPVPDNTDAFINRTWGTGTTPVATFGNIIAYHEMRRLQLGVRVDF